MRYAVVAALLLGATLGGSLVLAREPDTAAKVEAQDLFLKEFAGDPSKEVRSHLYTFPPEPFCPGTSIPTPTRSPM